MTSLKKQTVKGIKWLTIASIAEKTIQTLTTVVLARLLSPADFGLFALAFVAMRSMDLFRSMGFDSALIQRKNDVKEAANTAFCIIILLGILIYATLNFAAPFLAKFFNTTSLGPIIRALSLVFVLGAISRISAAMMEKNIRFGALSFIDIITAIMFSICAISLAITKHGVFSLVFAYAFKMFVKTILILISARWKPTSFKINKKLALEMFHFGKYRFADAIVYFFNRNTDNIIIGKFLGATLLGYYTLSFNLSNFLSRYLADKINRVLFPAFSKIQNDNKALKRNFLKSTSYISLICIPFAIVVFIFAPDIIHIVYGDKWVPAIPILKILVFSGSFQMLGSVIWPTLMAAGKSRELFWISVIMTVVFIGLVVSGSIAFGLLGTAYAVLLSRVISLVVGFLVASKILNIKIWRIMIQFRSAFASSLIMLIAGFMLRNTKLNLSLTSFHQIITFGIQFSGVCFSYIVTMLLLERAKILEMKGLLRT